MTYVLTINPNCSECIDYDLCIGDDTDKVVHECYLFTPKEKTNDQPNDSNIPA